MEHIKKYKIIDYDFALVAMVLGLTSFGIVAVNSADQSYLKKHLLGFASAVGLMIFVSVLDYTFVTGKFYIFIYIVNALLLGLVMSPLGSNTNGAQRWINIGGFTFQPSEAAKILLILFYAQFIMKYKDKVKNLGFIIVCLILLGIPLGLIAMQPDLSTCIMIMVIFSSIVFVEHRKSLI